MIRSLITVKILCLKNKLTKKDFILYSFAILLPFFVFHSSNIFLSELFSHPDFKKTILSNIISYMLCAFSLMLTCAAIISSVSNLYSSKDMSLLKVLPISKLKLLIYKFISLIFESSWMILLFFIPLILSCLITKNSNITSYLNSLFALFLLTTLSCSFAVLISNILVKKLGVKSAIEIIIFTLSCVVIYFVIFTNSANPNITNNKDTVKEFITLFSNSYQKSYLPHSLCSEVLIKSLETQTSVVSNSITSIFLLLVQNLIVFSFAYFSFNPNYIKKNKTYSGTKYKVPFKYKNSAFMSFAKKEFKLITRDFSQSTQLFLLIIITFVYLVNFQNLKNAKDIISVNWWQVMLAISNISLGTCVLTAIATRFIFPSISIEGKNYELLKTLPITKRKFIFYKFLTWLCPYTIFSFVILCSGALAIDANMETILVTALLSIALSISISSCAIWHGTKYAKFEWNHPTEISASIGSLIFMIKTFFNVYVYLIFSTILFICSNVNIDNKNFIFIGTILLLFIYTFYSTKRYLNKSCEYKICYKA